MLASTPLGGTGRRIRHFDDSCERAERSASTVRRRFCRSGASRSPTGYLATGRRRWKTTALTVSPARGQHRASGRCRRARRNGHPVDRQPGASENGVDPGATGHWQRVSRPCCGATRAGGRRERQFVCRCPFAQLEQAARITQAIAVASSAGFTTRGEAEEELCGQRRIGRRWRNVAGSARLGTARTVSARRT